MVSRNKERVATGLTGAAIVGGGAHLREMGVDRADKLVGKPPPRVAGLPMKALQLTRLTKQPGRGKARALYAGGSLLATAGAAPLGVAILNKTPAREGRQVIKRDSAKTFVGSGVQGTHDALRGKAQNLKEPKSAKAYAAASSVSLGSGALGSAAAHLAYDRRDKVRALRGLKPSRLRAAAVGIAGATALTSSLPMANQVMRRASPGYEVTPYGVKRAKTAPKPASSKASVFEGRASQGADSRIFRSQVVGKRDQPLVLKPKEQKNLAGTKRKSANLSVLGGGISLAGLGLLAAGKTPAATKLGIIGGGVGGTNALLGAKVQRKEAKALETSLRKSLVVPYVLLEHDEKLPMHVVAKAEWYAKRDGRQDTRRNQRTGAAMTASGTVLGTTGLVAGGIPGIKEPKTAELTRRSKVYGNKTMFRPSHLAGTLRAAGPYPRAGILGARVDLHREQIKRLNADKALFNPYQKGVRDSQLESERKIIRGMKIGRRASYALTIGGTGLAAAGLHRHSQKVNKRAPRDDTKSAAAFGGGATLAGVAHLAPKGLDRYGRQFTASSQAHTRAAQRLAPHLGGLRMEPAKKSRLTRRITPEHLSLKPETHNWHISDQRMYEKIKGGPRVQEQVGRHRGTAATERHFAEVFHNTGKGIRALRLPALAAAGVGATGLYRNRDVRKASWGTRMPLGALKAPTLRPSSVQTRRYAGGILKPVRMKASIG